MTYAVTYWFYDGVLYRARDVTHEIWDVEGWRKVVPSEEEVGSTDRSRALARRPLSRNPRCRRGKRLMWQRTGSGVLDTS